MTTGDALIILPDGSTLVEPFRNELKQLQDAVGGYVESVRFVLSGFPYCMMVNEDGVSQNLAPNGSASLLYWLAGGVTNILGPVVIVSGWVGPDGEQRGLGVNELLLLRDALRDPDAFA